MLDKQDTARYMLMSVGTTMPLEMMTWLQYKAFYVPVNTELIIVAVILLSLTLKFYCQD
jgi:hypothetical protein